ncbi:MAG: hypothetical protein AABX12_04565 [Nanoarchaeota archaeon]
MKAASLARLEKRLRPLITLLSPRQVVKIYSKARLDFLAKIAEEPSLPVYVPPAKFERVLWGLHFRGSLMNAAGMFKNGECYPLVAHEGAAAYLGGTGTFNQREGNREPRTEIYLPFAPYPRSGAASNWLGLPNYGDEINADNTSRLERINGCSIGWSAMGSPDYRGDEKLEKLVASLRAYERAGVDFLEINESCPNTTHGKPQDDDLARRLKYLADNFLRRRERILPVVVKFSNDTPVEQVRPLMDLLFEHGYDGVNFGNTSTDYAKRRTFIDPAERALYDFFTTNKARFGVGGGVSGRPLKEDSLLLCAIAVQHLRAGRPAQEFHVIRTGGIENAEDLLQSDAEGISLNQWFTGRWAAFAEHGYNSYRRLYEEYLRLTSAA